MREADEVETRLADVRNRVLEIGALSHDAIRDSEECIRTSRRLVDESRRHRARTARQREARAVILDRSRRVRRA